VRKDEEREKWGGRNKERNKEGILTCKKFWKELCISIFLTLFNSK
jgi:hypothetical protein